MKYYTAKEARKVLGNISPTRLKRYVDNGLITRVVPPDGGWALYPQGEVNRLAARMRAFYAEGDEEGAASEGEKGPGARKEKITHNGRGVAHRT